MKLFFRVFLCSLSLLATKFSYSQTDSLLVEKAEMNINGFVDVFYCYDFNEPGSTYRQPFLYNHNRHNEFNINLALVKMELNHSKYRSNITLQAGTYAIDNYAAEDQVLKHVFEANAGISLNRKNNLWLDAGIFPSHIGFESAISMDNWTLTRSLLAENSPYFLTGAKLTYNPSDNFEIAALITNGWQRIAKVRGNSLPSFGTQVSYNPNEKLSVNWSTFVGTDDPDLSRRMRYFNNLYSVFLVSEKLGMIAGFDFGIQEKFMKANDYEVWFTPVLITRYSISDKWATALRVEYFHDETGIIISGGNSGFKTSGFSANVDYIPLSNVACRIEGRWFNSEDAIFTRGRAAVNDNYFIVASLAVKLQK